MILQHSTLDGVLYFYRYDHETIGHLALNIKLVYNVPLFIYFLEEQVEFEYIRFTGTSIDL